MKIPQIVSLFFIVFLCLQPPSVAAQDGLATINQRLQILEDKEAIRTLLQDYGRHVDDRDWRAFADLFAANGGTWDGGMGVATGRAEIIDMMESSIGSGNSNASGNGYSNVHLLSNEIIEVDGQRAEAVSKWVFIMTGTEGGPDVVLVGRYLDQLIKEQGEWKFLNRKVLADIARPLQLGANSDN